MTFSNLGVGWMEYPKLATLVQTTFQQNLTTLDASGEYLAWIGPVSDTGTITKISFMLGLVTTGGDLDIRVETLDGSGFPSGTLKSTNSDITISVGAGDDNIVKTVALTSGASVTANGWIAVKIRGNAVSTPNLQLRSTSNWRAGTPYRVVDTGTPTKGDYQPAFSMLYSDGSLMRQPFGLMLSVSTQTFDNGGFLGNKFQLPCDMKVKGFYFVGDMNVDATCTLFGPNGAEVIATSTVYYGMCRAAGSFYPRTMIWSADVDLKAHTRYRIGLKSSSATTSSLSTVEHLAQVPFGTGWWMDQSENLAHTIHLTESSVASPTGESDWTDTLNELGAIGIIPVEISEWVNPTHFFVPQQVFV